LHPDDIRPFGGNEVEIARRQSGITDQRGQLDMRSLTKSIQQNDPMRSTVSKSKIDVYKTSIGLFWV